MRLASNNCMSQALGMGQGKELFYGEWLLAEEDESSDLYLAGGEKRQAVNKSPCTFLHWARRQLRLVSCYLAARLAARRLPTFFP